MTTTVVSGATTLEAWRAGVDHVVARHELNNLLTTIEDPCSMNADWLGQFSPSSIRPQYDNIRDVVNTIFPITIAQRWPTRPELYDRYLARHDRAARWRRNRSAWGSYFERLIRFPPGVNQLDRAIEKLRQWPRRSTTGLVFHLASPATDAPRTRGGPCWHFAEILWQHEDVLDLVVVYRNHDFLNKALGNFIGLGQLLKFICVEGGKQPGKLICHSVHAYSGGSVGDLKELAT